MQLIRPTSEFKVGHFPFQGKVKGILPRWGSFKRNKRKSSVYLFETFHNLIPTFSSRARSRAYFPVWEGKC